MSVKNIDATNKPEKKSLTKTEFKFHNLIIPFLKELNINAVALDIGYNGLKIYSIYGKHIIPSLPINMGKERRLEKSVIGYNETAIQYKDENNFVWFVGDIAIDMIDSGKATYNYETLYGKTRITTPEYLVLLRTGIALSLIKNMDELKKPNYKIKPDNLKIMTGLPEDWMGDKEKLVSVFSGIHKFSIKVGNSSWIPVTIELNEGKDTKDVFVMSQPKGTIFSMATSVYGDIIKPDLLLNNNVLVFDGGFRTNDLYYMKKGQKAHSTSITESAMFEVYRDVCDDIFDETNQTREIRVYELDRYILDDNKIVYIEPSKDENEPPIKKTYNFKNLIDKHTEEYAKRSISKLNNLYLNFQDVDYVICTGGTGEAYFPYFKKLIPTEVILAKKEDGNNPAENFIPVFANVIGFFCNLVGTLKQLYAKSTAKDSQAVKEVASTSEIKTSKANK